MLLLSRAEKCSKKALDAARGRYDKQDRSGYGFRHHDYRRYR